MRHLILLLTLIGLAHAEEKMSLNGPWKFTTIPGDGSDYTDITVRPTDIVIDNDHSEHVKVTGDWKTKTIGERGSFFYGKDYLGRWFKDGESAEHHVRYSSTAVPHAGHYELFINYGFNLHMSTQFNVQHEGGRYTKHHSQRVREHQWLSLGIFKLDPAKDHYLEITATTNRGVTADAVMFRPVSERQIIASDLDRIHATAPTFDDSNWDTLTVPGHWGMLNKYSNYSGKGWYRKQFTLPPNWQANPSERVTLKFHAVYHVARVFVNGTEIGSHRGGFTPFEFDVTDHLNFDGPNLIAVEADNNYIVGATYNWGGIIRDVELIKHSDLRITYQYIHAEPNLEKGTADLTLKVRVKNNAPTKRTTTLSAGITRYQSDKILTTLTGQLAIPAGAEKEVTLTGNLTKDQIHLWHFDFPNLYTLSTTATVDQKKLHTHTDRFGIRKIAVTDSQLFLNGEPVRLAGFNRVSDHRYWGSSEPQEIIDQDVDLMKNAGANMMRIMHGTQNRKLIERCEEKGILLIEEINVRDLTNQEFTAPDYPLAKQWLREMIERDINSPAIIGWSTGNELSDHYDYVKTTINFVKQELDPHRLVACVSNTGHRAQDTPNNDPLGLGDLILQNCYQQRPDSMADSIRAKWPDKAIFFSEFGLGRFSSPSLDQTVEGLENWHTSIKGQRDYVIGAALWTYNDYRSSYLATLPSENRAWGLVNVWRQKRRLYDQVAAIHSPVKHHEISPIIPSKKSANLILHFRGPEDYPSFTLRDYTLTTTFRTTDGKVVSKTSQKLPTIPPGDKPWSGQITWKDLPQKDLLDCTIRLITPNGYVRFEKVIALSRPSKSAISAITPGDQSVRLHFEHVAGATEYSARYLDHNNVARETHKTIDDHLDVTGLRNGQNYRFQLLAWNDKGYSITGHTTASPNGNPLPPIIWDASITDGKLVIGYDGQVDDQSYEIHYGPSADQLTQKLTDNVRGMFTIDLNGASKAAFQMRRTSADGTSNWTPIKTVEKPFRLKLGKVDRKSKFEIDGVSVWGGSMVKGDDGLYHMFYSRWPKTRGWAWLTYSQIGHAVSTSPFGPFEHKGWALADRGAQYWDGATTHNPHVHRFGDKYYLYYMGTTGDKKEESTPGNLVFNVQHRNNQRIGVAVADSPYGPWKRFDQPLIDFSTDDNAPDALMVSNPSVTQRPDGTYLLIYKAAGKKKPGVFGGPVVHCVATSDSPTGPFKKHDHIVFDAPGYNFPAEDPFIWYQDGKYRAIVKDMHGAFTDAGQALVNFESEDGFDWKLSETPLLTKLEIHWADGELQKLKHLERPQLYLENGKPIALLTAADIKDKNGILHSFNVQIPIEK